MATPAILSIQSQVIFGHVGNSAAAFALQRMGFDVLAVPTVLLSHHPGHGAPAGRALTGEEATALIQSLARCGALDAVSGTIVGYLGQAEMADAALGALARIPATARVLIDPVIGDAGGIYVRAGIMEAFRDRLIPRAMVATPNRFELGWLTGQTTETLTEAIAAARALMRRGPAIVACTSAPLDDPARTGALLVTAEGAWLAETPRLKVVPNGSGDLFAALLLAHLLGGLAPPAALARATAAVHETLTLSEGTRELRLIEAQAILARPPRPIAARKID